MAINDMATKEYMDFLLHNEDLKRQEAERKIVINAGEGDCDFTIDDLAKIADKLGMELDISLTPRTHKSGRKEGQKSE